MTLCQRNYCVQKLTWLYGLVRKKIQVDAQSGMLIETLWLFPLAAIYLFGIADSATSHLSANPLSLNLMLVAAGVLTTIPLMLFAAEHSLLYKNKTKGNTFLLREAGCQTLLYSQCKPVQL